MLKCTQLNVLNRQKVEKNLGKEKRSLLCDLAIVLVMHNAAAFHDVCDRSKAIGKAILPQAYRKGLSLWECKNLKKKMNLVEFGNYYLIRNYL